MSTAPTNIGYPRQGSASIDDAVAVVDEVRGGADEVVRERRHVGGVERRGVEPVAYGRQAAANVVAAAEAVGDTDVPEPDGPRVTGLADPVETGGRRPGAGAVVGEEVVEERRLGEERARVDAVALVELGLEQEAVGRRGEPCGHRLAIARDCGRRGDVVRDRVVGEHDIRRIVECDAAALVRRDVVRDRVVEDVDAVVVQADGRCVPVPVWLRRLPSTISSRMPPPSSLARLACRTFSRMSTAPAPTGIVFGLTGSSLPTKTAPPSS